MSVRADIYTETSEETLSVPIQAVLYDEDLVVDAEDEPGGATEQAYVYVMEDGKAIRKNVKTGISSDSDQEILSGLEQGEMVVTGPFRTLRKLVDGDAIEAADDSGTGAEEEDGEHSVTIST
jgi:HlyD family secretion protein